MFEQQKQSLCDCRLAAEQQLQVEILAGRTQCSTSTGHAVKSQHKTNAVIIHARVFNPALIPVPVPRKLYVPPKYVSFQPGVFNTIKCGAGPGKRARREKLASPVQAGPPATDSDQSAGSPSTVCFRPGTGSVQPVPGPACKGSRGEREASAATEERSSVARAGSRGGLCRWLRRCSSVKPLPRSAELRLTYYPALVPG